MKELKVSGYTNPVLCARKAIEGLYPESVFDEQNVQAVAAAIGDRPDISGRIIRTISDIAGLAAEAGFIVWFTPSENHAVRFEVWYLK